MTPNYFVLPGCVLFFIAIVATLTYNYAWNSGYTMGSISLEVLQKTISNANSAIIKYRNNITELQKFNDKKEAQVAELLTQNNELRQQFAVAQQGIQAAFDSGREQAGYELEGRRNEAANAVAASQHRVKEAELKAEQAYDKGFNTATQKWNKAVTDAQAATAKEYEEGRKAAVKSVISTLAERSDEFEHLMVTYGEWATSPRKTSVKGIPQKIDEDFREYDDEDMPF